MIRAAIIDDEPLAREGLANYVREVDFLDLVGICENPLELMELLDKEPVDLIFLDIQMPKMSGIDFLKISPNPPLVILTTAFPSYALEGFRLNVLDYLLKPITFDRFLQAARKAKAHFSLLKQQEPVSSSKDDHFFVKCNQKYEKILFDDILYIQGMQNYVNIHTLKGKYMTLLTLKDILNKLEGQPFMRVHKSYIIATSKIESVESHELIINSIPIPLSRNYRDELLERVVAKKLWRR
ncbi:MAG: LytTR family DNA-binding domain-containing protein [Bacteroidota bacterium]